MLVLAAFGAENEMVQERYAHGYRVPCAGQYMRI